MMDGCIAFPSFTVMATQRSRQGARTSQAVPEARPLRSDKIRATLYPHTRYVE
jgi:hypothetical protein